jgi:hypothetical protein
LKVDRATASNDLPTAQIPIFAEKKVSSSFSQMSEKNPPLLAPQQIAQIGEALVQEDRPNWSRKALAKLLSLIFPNIPTRRWETCFGDPSGLRRLVSILSEDEAWVLGRIHRALTEARNAGLFAKSPLSGLAWMETADFTSGSLEGGGGFSAVVASRLEIVLRGTPDEQILFWRSFSDAFSLPISSRQEPKTILAYMFFVISWKEVQKCRTIREAYEEFCKRFPLDPVPSEVDAIDFEEQRLKWFEKLSQRNLGLQLRPRGRPSRKRKNPQY